MKKINFGSKSAAELKALSLEARKALLNLRVEKEQRKIKDVHVLNKKRKELASILTALAAKEKQK